MADPTAVTGRGATSSTAHHRRNAEVYLNSKYLPCRGSSLSEGIFCTGDDRMRRWILHAPYRIESTTGHWGTCRPPERFNGDVGSETTARDVVGRALDHAHIPGYRRNLTGVSAVGSMVFREDRGRHRFNHAKGARQRPLNEWTPSRSFGDGSVRLLAMTVARAHPPAVGVSELSPLGAMRCRDESLPG